MSPNRSKPIQIKYENASDYKPNPDSDYFVADSKQDHLKLRVLRTGQKTWVYDYLYNGKRKRHSFGELAKEAKGKGLTPPQARQMVADWEAIRRQGKNPMLSQDSDIKRITLNKFFDEDFLNLNYVKPSVIRKKNAKGVWEEVRQGQTTQTYKQNIAIWNNHVRKDIGDTPVIDLQVKVINSWWSKIAENTPSHSIKIMGLVRFVMKELLNMHDDLDSLTSNKFIKIRIAGVRKGVDDLRKPKPIEAPEFKALWEACKEWHNPVEGLYIQFIMATSARGQAVADIKCSDIKQKNGRYHFNTLHKNKLFPIVMNELVESIYLQTLEARKKYPLSPYLFPKYIYDSERNITGVAKTAIDSATRQRIWRGRSTKQSKGKLVVNTNGGLRGLASKTCRSVLTVGLHDVRDTFASHAENVQVATDMLQNKLTSTTDKHYREKQFIANQSTADKQLEIVKQLIG